MGGLAVHGRAGGMCERCRGNPIDAVHHLTYIRKYNELLEDLQGICSGCHDFIHGKSDVDPITLLSVILKDGTRIKTVYLAGKCNFWTPLHPNENGVGRETVSGWRNEITTKWRTESPNSAYQEWIVPEYHIEKNAIKLQCGKYLDYSGPYFVQNHGEPIHHDNKIIDDEYKTTHVRAIKGINDCDLLFAWIESEDCYGTIAEIGYAKGIGKKVIICGPKYYPELWFVYNMGMGKNIL